MAKKPIFVKSASGPYAVMCEAGIMGSAARKIAALGRWSSVHVVTSPRGWGGVGRSVLRGLALRGTNHIHFLNDAETSKNLRTMESVARSMIRAGADRNSLLVAVGGGVVGDVAGFAAASYLRGVALAQVPTTLVAQVDSAVGGKTGVNLPEGKNLVGAFYPPRLVLADPQLLRTLPEREFRSGLAEVIKYGVIADAELFGFLEKHLQAVLRRDGKALGYMIRRCIEIKAAVVGRDERESGLREILNFGHTFGHALESVTGYRRFQHGEAVAWGMMCAALLGHEIGVTRADDVSRIVALVRRIGPFPKWPDVPIKSLLAAMRSDKKTREGKIRFVLSPRIGKAQTYGRVRVDAEQRVLHFAPHFFIRHAENFAALTLGKTRG